MKIAFILENQINVGGGFTMSNDLINLAIQCCKDQDIEFLVYNFNPNNSKLLKKNNINFKNVRENFLDKLFVAINDCLPGSIIQRKIRYISFFERNLLKDNVDLVFFTLPSSKIFFLQKLNFVLTVMDLCHQDYPEFSEVSSFNTFELRQKVLNYAIPKSVFTIVESEALKRKVNFFFKKQLDKIIPIPNTFSSFLNDNFKKYDVSIFKSNYLFYPAQYWEHKNHIRILEALKLLKEQNIIKNVVFCGSDRGNKNFILKKIKEFKLENQVEVLGFVPTNDLYNLYLNCTAVLMPTYFGPTNIPPLDAWYLKKPIIYSKHLEEQTKNGALYFDPDSPEELAKCILEIENPNKFHELIRNGEKCLNDVLDQRKKSMEHLKKNLKSFSSKLKCWK